MKICLFRPSLDINDGGPARSIPILAKGLKEIGLDVTIMTFKTKNINLHVLNDSEVKVVIIPQSASFSEVKEIIEEAKFDIIHIQSIWSIWIHRIASIARSLKIKYMMTPRGTLEPWGIYNQGFLKMIKKLAVLRLFLYNDIQKSSCILATADSEMNNLRKLKISNPIAIIPNGLDFSDYPCRSKESFSCIKKQVLFLSRINPKKGIELLISAWKKISVMFPEWKLLIVGNGEAEYVNKLKEKIINAGIDKVVSIGYPAFGKEKYELYKSTSLFILPTYSENFGMVIAEALACGVPVITTKNTPWQLLETTNSGWWIDLSISNIEQALIDAINLTPDELFEMGQNGATMVRNNFNYIEIAKKLKDVYEWVLNPSADKPQYIYN